VGFGRVASLPSVQQGGGLPEDWGWPARNGPSETRLRAALTEAYPEIGLSDGGSNRELELWVCAPQDGQALVRPRRGVYLAGAMGSQYRLLLRQGPYGC